MRYCICLGGVSETGDSQNDKNSESEKNKPMHRKALMFSSSIATNIEKELQCDIEVVTVYHVIKNKSDKDPELYLEKQLGEKMSHDIDFIIVRCGSNDISCPE